VRVERSPKLGCKFAISIGENSAETIAKHNIESLSVLILVSIWVGSMLPAEFFIGFSGCWGKSNYNFRCATGAANRCGCVAPCWHVNLWLSVNLLASCLAVRPSSGRAVNLGVFLQLNLPRTEAKSNIVIGRMLSTNVSS
jgi:hypothetical protein